MSITQQIERILYGVNYEVHLFDRIAELNEQFALQDAIGNAFGLDSIVVGGQVASSKVEVLREIAEKLSYSGDESHGPHKEQIESESFQQLLARYMNDLDSWIDEDDFVFAFWIKENHPAYPVFWDYAFYIESSQKKRYRVLIGSSSD